MRLLFLLLWGHEPRRQRAAHLLKLCPGRHLLREQRGLDAVEEPFQPADQLRLCDTELRFARRRVSERQGQPLKLFNKLRGEPVLELLDGVLVNLP